MYDNKFYSLKGLVAAYNENPNTSVARYFKEMSTLEENEGIINFDEETGEASIAEGASDFKRPLRMVSPSIARKTASIPFTITTTTAITTTLLKTPATSRWALWSLQLSATTFTNLA